MPLASSKAARTSWNAASSAPPQREVTRIEPSPSSRSAGAPLAPGSSPSPHAARVSTATMAGARNRDFRMGSSTCSVSMGTRPLRLDVRNVRGPLPGQRLLRIRVEDVQLLHRHREVDGVTDTDLLVRWQQRHDLVPLGLCVDELLVPEVLDHVDLGREANGVALLAVGKLDVLRTEADEHVGAVGARVGGPGLLS